MSLSGFSPAMLPAGLTGSPSLSGISGNSSPLSMDPMTQATGSMNASLGALGTSPLTSLGGSALGGSALGGSPMGGSALGGSQLGGGNISGAISQILSMLVMLLQALLPMLTGGAGAQQQGSGLNGPVTQSSLAASPDSYAPTPSPNYSGGGSPAPGSPYTPSGGGNSPSQGAGNNSQSPGNNNGNSAGWNKNVSIMTSSDAQHETTDSYSGGQLVGGYLHDLEDGMDAGQNIDQANANAQSKNTEGATSANVNPNSLVKGKGGKALIVTGDNYGNDGDADQLANKLRKNYGMDVKVIKNASPNQVKAAMQEMGQQGGQQAMVAVLAHGAHDDSGQNKGNMAMGKGDGDQWLTEDMLKSEVNQYLSPSFGNVNVLLNSCYSGNYAS